MDEVLKNVINLCELKDITLDIQKDETIILYCDKRWEIEALTNIVKNCIDYSKSHSKIVIRYTQNNVYTMVSIQDFGSGIKKEDLPHVFKRFYKGKNASSNSVGIGLSLSKKIIEEDNGTIVVSSTNKGTIFKIKYFKI